MQREIEVMRVLRVPPLGRLVVEINGKPVEQLTDIKEPALRQRLLAAIGELVTFAGGYELLVDAGLAPAVGPTPTAAPASSTTEATPAVDDDTLEQRRAAFLAALESQVQEPPSSSVLNQPSLLGALRRPRREPEAPPLSLAEQIDAVLQAKMASIPQLAGRSIHLRSDPKGGLRIEVDGRFYQRPSEIEDRNIALLIKAAIKEWEKSQ